jgi:type II secretory pathway component PulL
MRSAAVLALVALAVLAGALGVRAVRYAGVADRARDEAARLFRDLNPNVPVPGSVTSRLRSDLARLEGVRDASDTPDRPSALDSLRRLTAGLPPAVRVRILELRLTPDTILLDGQTRSHSDAEAVGQSLTASGLQMQPPVTERLSSGETAFTLTGRMASPEGRIAQEGAAP